MTRMKRVTTNHRPLTTRSAFLSAAFAHATAGGLWFSGQWSVVFPTLFPSLSSVKIFLRDEGVAFTATANRKFATANPSRGGRGTLAPLYDGQKRRGAACTAPRRLNLLACYRELANTAKRHLDLVRAVPSARYEHPVRIGSLPSAVDVIGIETTLVRHGGNQRAVAIDVDETRGRPTPEEIHLLQAVYFVTTRVQRDLHRCRCRCRRCSRRRGWCRRRRGSRRRRWCGCRARTNRAVEDFHRVYRGSGSVTACQPDVVGSVGIGGEVA